MSSPVLSNRNSGAEYDVIDNDNRDCTGNELNVGVPQRRSWSAFDHERQASFCRLLSHGVSRNRAMKILGLNPSTVNRWIALGREPLDAPTDRANTEEGGRAKYREFWLEMERAEALADALVDIVLVQAALGVEVETVADDGTRTRIRGGADWRAAEALGRRRERRELSTLVQRLKRAEVQIALANIETARANARRARALAVVAERQVNSSNGALVLSSTLLAQCTQPERDVIEGIIRRLGAPETTPVDPEL